MNIAKFAGFFVIRVLQNGYFYKMNNVLIYYLVIINSLSFIIFGIDKWKAKNFKSRIPEWLLLLCSLMGGTIGSVLGMLVFRHKTSKISFKLKFILTIISQLLFVYIFWQGF